MDVKHKHKTTGVLSATAIGVTSIIGSGWLFACYYTAQLAGSMSILAWIIGALFALVLALMLAEISTLFPVRGLMARLLSLSHNKDMGFVIAASNWLGVILVIPSEAQATVQYLSHISESFQKHIMSNGSLNAEGMLIVLALIVIYGLVNYWGIKILTKVTNIISIFKIFVPLITACILFYVSFNPHNFTSYHNTWAPYGILPAFTAVVTGGIFYSFFGFGAITTFASEIKNPQRNLPIALILCIAICLVIYLMLQIAFIGATPAAMVAKGWHNINFSSPLVELVLLFNLNFWAVVLYLDAALSPSGTAIAYVGSAGRILTGMSRDKQMPNFFASMHEKFNISRRSLVVSLISCFIIVLFFRSWQAIVIVISALQLLTCAAVPVALVKFRETKANETRSFKLMFGKTLSALIFILVTYLMIQAGSKALIFALILHAILFVFYISSQYKANLGKSIRAFVSSWSIFFYLAVILVMSFINEKYKPESLVDFGIFIIISLVMYYFMLNQKSVQKEETTKEA